MAITTLEREALGDEGTSAYIDCVTSGPLDAVDRRASNPSTETQVTAEHMAAIRAPHN